MICQGQTRTNNDPRGINAVVRGLVLACLFVVSLCYISIDNGWLLEATSRWLSGEVLYRDILETNPPLILWLYSVPVWVAQTFSLSLPSVFSICVWLLMWHMLCRSAQRLRRHPILSETHHYTAFLLTITLFWTICSASIFGQREYLWVLFATPYFIQSLGLRHEPEWSAGQAIMAVVAALGFALKPFFVVVWLANELYLALVAHNISLLVRRTNRVIVATGAIYIAAVWWFTPEYFTHILPMLWATYDAYNSGVNHALTVAALLAIVFVVPGLIALRYLPCRALMGQLLVAFVSACAVFIMQKKGWYNHYWPAFFFGGLVLALPIAQQGKRMREHKEMPSLPAFAGLWLMGMTVVCLPVLETWRISKRLGTDPEISTMQRHIEEQAAGQKIMILSINLDSAFPLMSYTNAQHIGHFHHLWTLPAVMIAEQGTLPISQEMSTIKRYTLDTIAKDIEKHTPELVLIYNVDGWPEMAEYLAQDSVFAGVWGSYDKTSRVVFPTPHDEKSSMPAGSWVLYKRQ